MASLNTGDHDKAPALPSRPFLHWLLDQIPRSNANMPLLPCEVKSEIIGNTIGFLPAAKYRRAGLSAATRTSLLSRSPAYKPPLSGESPFMSLSTELRRQIFSASLPDREHVHGATCESDSQAHTATQKPTASDDYQSCSPRRNTVADLMCLNKKIAGEISEVLYEERYFVIHVHEGLGDGGIEFLNTGRQPLQYKDDIRDQRFNKFGENDEFGFRRLKKIILQIFPPSQTESRHTPINTYFVNLALCRLLERSGDEKHRITSLKIEFPELKDVKEVNGRAAIQRAEQYWWDPNTLRPRSTSVHLLSNIELVLRPFAMLTDCCSVDIDLPGNVRNHKPTVDFVAALTRSMTSRLGSLFLDDDLEKKIESARMAMEEYIVYTVKGAGYHAVAKLTDAEMQEDEFGYVSDDDLDGDNSGKHDLSPASKNSGGDWKRLPGQSRSQWEEGQQMVSDSHRSRIEEEDRALAEAIEASLRDEREAKSLEKESELLRSSTNRVHATRAATASRLTRFDILPGSTTTRRKVWNPSSLGENTVSGRSATHTAREPLTAIRDEDAAQVTSSKVNSAAPHFTSRRDSTTEPDDGPPAAAAAAASVSASSSRAPASVSKKPSTAPQQDIEQELELTDELISSLDPEGHDYDATLLDLEFRRYELERQLATLQEDVDDTPSTIAEPSSRLMQGGSVGPVRPSIEGWGTWSVAQTLSQYSSRPRPASTQANRLRISRSADSFSAAVKRGLYASDGPQNPGPDASVSGQAKTTQGSRFSHRLKEKASKFESISKKPSSLASTNVDSPDLIDLTGDTDDEDAGTGS